MLALLATHFGFTWRKKGQGYELWQEIIARRREQELRDENAWRLIRYGIELGQEIRQTNAEDREAHIDRLRNLAGFDLDADGVPPAIKREYTRLTQMRGRGAELLAVLTVLTRPQLHRLAQQGSIRLSSIDGTLGDDAIRELNGQRRAVVEAHPTLTDLPVPKDWQISYEILSINGDSQMQLVYQAIGWPGSSFDETRGSIVTELPPRWSVIPSTGLSSFDRTATLRRPPPSDLALNDVLLPVLWMQQPRPAVPTLGKFLITMHRTLGIDVIADSFPSQRLESLLLEHRWAYDADRSDRPSYMRMPTFADILNRAGFRLNLVGVVEDDILRLRSIEYPRMRRQRVPGKVISEMVRKIRADSSDYMDLIGRIASQLTGEQQAGLCSAWNLLWKNDVVFVPRVISNDASEPLYAAKLMRLIPRIFHAQQDGEVRVQLEDLSAAA